MGTHAVNLAFAAELVSVPSVKSFRRNYENPARTERTRRVQQRGIVTVKAAQATPAREALPPDLSHELPFERNLSVMHDCISTRTEVDHGDTPISSSWAISLCDDLEKKMMSWALGDDTCEQAKSYLLSGNYAPVEEMAPTTDLLITGTIPVHIVARLVSIISLEEFYYVNFC